MTEKRSNEFMLDLLKRVQPMQIEVLKKGYSAHIDTGINSYWDDKARLSFDFTIFEGTDIAEQYEFHYLDTEEQLEATLAKLRADINAL